MTLIVIIATPVAMFLLYLGWRRLNETDEEKLIRLTGESMNDARRRGLSFEQWNEEMAFRECYAKIRRIASDAVVANPANPHQTIKEIIETETHNLARVDPKVAKRTSDVLSNAPMSDILYEDALALARSWYAEASSQSSATMKLSKQQIEDRISALTTLK